MMHEQVFPDFAVKQAMREVKIERDDDMIIRSIQSDLLTRCVNIIVKGAVVSCVHHGRKYVSERDVQYAMLTTTFPISSVQSCKVGYLLDTRQLGVLCHTHIKLVIDMMERGGIKSGEIKISADVLLVMQDAVERLVRGFFGVFKTDGSTRTYSYRLFDETMSRLIGDPSAGDGTFVKWDARQ